MIGWRGLLLLVLLLWPALAHAHPQSPVSLQVVELDGHAYAVTLRRAVVDRDHLRIDPPPPCRERSSASQQLELELVDVIAWQCDAPIVGQSLALPGLRLLAASALVIVVPRAGPTVHGVLTPDAPTWIVPAVPTTTGVLARYLELGARHLGSGLDHLLLVLALVVLAPGLRRLVATVTAFTLGHSATLCAAALGWVAVPLTWAELGIAITLVIVALQVLEADPARRLHAPALATVFGLVHGLGFAGALAELGLPEGARMPALLGFNVGLELAQLAVVLLAWPLWHACLRHAPRRAARVRAVLGYATGALACMWIIERVI